MCGTSVAEGSKGGCGNGCIACPRTKLAEGAVSAPGADAFGALSGPSRDQNLRSAGLPKATEVEHHHSHAEVPLPRLS